MGEKDIAEKILEDYPDVFADIVNGFLFDGEVVIKPEELEDMPGRSAYRAENKLWKTCPAVPPTGQNRNSTIWSVTWLSGGRRTISVLPA